MPREVASTKELNDPRNRAKVEQALNLISRGKAGVAGRDPALRPFVNALLELGARDITQIRARPSEPESEVPEPTETEQELLQSLLANLRNLPAEQVRSQQGVRGFFQRSAQGDSDIDAFLGRGVSTPFGFSVAPSLQDSPGEIDDDPNLFGGIAITEADTSLGSFLERRNPVTGTLTFASEKFQGFVGRLEEEFTPRGQSIARTGLISRGLQVAPFVTPATAPTALVATGVGSVTPGGLREAQDVGVSLEESFGVPAKAGTVGFTGIQVVGGAIGARGLVGQAERMAGYPRFNTKFLAQQQNVAQAGDEALLQTTTAGTVTRRGLLSQREAIFAAESLTKVTPEAEAFTFQSGTRGVLREFQGFKFPTTQRAFGEPTKFGSLTEGFGKQGEQQIVLDIAKGMKVSRGVEGFQFASSTRSFLPGKDPMGFFSLGKGFELPSGIVTSSKFAPLQRSAFGDTLKLSRQGRGNVFGLTKLPQESEAISSGFILKTKKDKLAKSIQQQSIQEALAKSFSIPKPSQSFKPAVAIAGTEKSRPRIISTQKDQLNLQTTSRQGVSSAFNVISSKKDALKLSQGVTQGLGLGKRQKQTGRLASKIKLSTDQAQMPAQAQLPKQRLREGLIQRQKGQQKTTPPGGFFVPPPTFSLPKRIPLIAFPPIGFDFGKGVSPRGRRKFTRRPSLISAELGIFSLKPLKGETTGLIARPLIKKKRKKKKK